MALTMWSVLGNSQKLDGGAMYGNAPKALWQRWSPPDADGLIPLATRCLLVQEESGRNVLFETGIGAFFAPDLRARFGVVESNHVLLENLAALGFAPADIDIVVLSHLHFDHAGGLLEPWTEGAAPRLAFPDASVVVSDAAWQRALQPHVRDRASYIPGLPELLLEADHLEIVEGDRSELLGDPYRFHRSEGHTPGLLLAEIEADGGPVVFAGDLVPGIPWIHVPITMGYDRYPELLIDEKAALLTDLEQRHGRLFFTHDPDVAMAEIMRSESGRFGVGRVWAEVAPAV